MCQSTGSAKFLIDWFIIKKCVNAVYYEYEDNIFFYSVRNSRAGHEERIININNIKLNNENYEKVGH